ncbi:Hypothetical predicted protein [Xyrichtys novacula]|uniref:Uncharacterized protein n=1 Tax=Xyrichtys novacula TaxID=13765 RepID=A0AAV1GDY5_XYRNO|nr:Hypothetical predicted protein [Xyrichtys novacula]
MRVCVFTVQDCVPLSCVTAGLQRSRGNNRAERKQKVNVAQPAANKRPEDITRTKTESEGERKGERKRVVVRKETGYKMMEVKRMEEGKKKEDSGRTEVGIWRIERQNEQQTE